MRGVLFGLAMGLAALWPGSSGEALAGPWGRAPGETYVSVDIARSSFEGLRATQTHAYAEHGLGQGITAVAKLDSVQYDDASGGDHRGWRVGVQRSQLLPLALVAAGGAGVQAGRGAAATACAEAGGVVWLGLGTSRGSRGRPWFAAVDAEGWHQGAACRGRSLSATFGRDLSPRLHIVQRIDWRRGRGEASTLKSETRLVLRRPCLAYSVAWREEQGGHFQEQAIILGLARLF